MMYSEVAFAELVAVLKNKRSDRLPPKLVSVSNKLRQNPATFIQVCKDIIAAIGALQEYWGMTHNDFHLGNVLITLDGETIVPLIHDFGNSTIVTVPLGAVERFPRIRELSEFEAAARRSGMTSDERVKDLTQLFRGLKTLVDDGDLPLAAASVKFINAGLQALGAYRGAGRTDARIFDELKALGDRHALGGGYRAPHYFGMYNLR
jgi:hypothetical protein